MLFFYLIGLKVWLWINGVAKGILPQVKAFAVVFLLRCESQAQPVRCDFEQADFSRFDAGRRDFVMFGVDAQFLAGKWQRLSHSQ
jgi:hypothetical protein